MPLNSLLLDATLVVAWLNISSVVSLDILHAEEVLIDAYSGSDKLYVPLSRGHQKVSSGH